MNQFVVDTDVSSYIFNWHSLAPTYVDALRGGELILSFMSIAELRMGAIAAGWGPRRRTMLEQFMQGFQILYADNNLSHPLGQPACRCETLGMATESSGRMDRSYGTRARCSARHQQPPRFRAYSRTTPSNDLARYRMQPNQPSPGKFSVRCLAVFTGG